MVQSKAKLNTVRDPWYLQHTYRLPSFSEIADHFDMKTAAVVLVALQLAGLVHAQGGRCTNSSVRACVANLEQFELDEYDSIVPTFDDAQLTNLCE